MAGGGGVGSQTEGRRQGADQMRSFASLRMTMLGEMGVETLILVLENGRRRRNGRPTRYCSQMQRREAFLLEC